MKKVKIPTLGKEVQLQSVVGQGAQAEIYSVQDEPSLLIKYYKIPTKADEDRITALLELLSTLNLQTIANYQFAWPLAKVFDDNDHFVGYVMENFKRGYRPLSRLFSLNRNKSQDYGLLLKIAENLAAAVEVLHKNYIVVGDLQPSNLLVSKIGLIVIIDTDSFQFVFNGTTYRSPLGSIEFTPCEMLGKAFGEHDRKTHHDGYALAVCFFKLWLFGHNLYQSQYIGKKGGQYTFLQKVRKNITPYFKANLKNYRIREMSPPLDIVHPQLLLLFRRCFLAGHRHPERRPSAAKWRKTIGMAIRDKSYLKNANRKMTAHIKKMDGVSQERIRCPPWLSWRSAFESVKSHPWMASGIAGLLALAIFLSILLHWAHTPPAGPESQVYIEARFAKPEPGKKSTPPLWKRYYEKPK